MVAQRELYPRDWWKRMRFVPFLMATGIGLAVTNSMAVIEALLGKQSEFVRTPKYRVELKEEGWEHKKYVRHRSGWKPYVELGMATYFVFTTAYSFRVENYLTVPFLLLFFIGYSYMGMMSLFQTPLRRLWNSLPALARSRPASQET
jgi:hypothetical protein